MPGRRVPINVFISHTDNDKLKMETDRTIPLRLDAALLLEEDLLVHAVVVPEDPKMGKLTGKVLQNISRSDYFLLLLTDASVRQPWVPFEIGAAYKSLAACRGTSMLTDDDRLNRFWVLVPDIHRKRPDFAVCDPLVRIPWKPDGPVEPVDSKEDRLRLYLTWDHSVRNEHVRSELGRRFLADTFSSDLGYIISQTGTLSQKKYELWLNAFATWSRGCFFAVSRQPLLYWWQRDGLIYRENLIRLHVAKCQIKRLNIWEKPQDGYPLNECGLIDDSMIARKADRPQDFTYCCQGAKVFDMLLGFLRDCHRPIEDACYIFFSALSTRIPSDWQELLEYKDEHVIKAKGVFEETVEYQLTSSHDDEVAEEFGRLFRGAKDGSLIVGYVSLPDGPKVPAAGTLVGLLKAIRSHHDSSCGSGRKIDVPSDVRDLWDSLDR